MKTTEELGGRPTRWLIAVGIAAMLVMLVGTVVVITAQAGPDGERLDLEVGLAASPTPPPDTWIPPEVYKYSNVSHLGLGDSVQFLISVVASDVISNEVTWHDVYMVDVISPALRIDDAMVIPDDSEHEVIVIDHTVIATAATMVRDEWFVVAVDCTLIDVSDPMVPIINGASVDYFGPDGSLSPSGTIFAEPVMITVVPGGKIYLPLLVRNYPPARPAPELSPISNPDGDGTYIVSWSTVPEATAYTLEEATDSGFVGAVVVYQGSNTSFGIGGRGPSRYFYRVKASDLAKESPWSNVEPVDVVWEMEPNNVAAQANGPIVSDVTYYGAFPSVADLHDWFYFDLEAPFPVVELWLSNIPAGTDYDLYLYDADENFVAKSDNYGNVNEHIQAPALPVGRYYVRVINYSQTGNGQAYRLKAAYEE